MNSLKNSNLNTIKTYVQKKKKIMFMCMFICMIFFLNIKFKKLILKLINSYPFYIF